MESVAVLARFAQYLGAALVFGWPVFSSLVRAPQPTARILTVGALTVAAGTLVSLSTQTATMMGDPAAALRAEEVWLVLAETTFGHGAATRVALCVIFLAAIALKAPSVVRIGLGAAVSASMAMTGHAAATEGLAGVAHQAADAIHMLAAASWIGALMAFFRAVFGSDSANTMMQTHGMLTRFAGVGSALVAALIVTGLFNAWILVTPSGVSHLTESDYGRWLAIKLGLFGLMLGLAAANRFALTPRLAIDLSRGAASLKVLRASIAIETALGAAVLGAVAVLGRLPPAIESMPAP